MGASVVLETETVQNVLFCVPQIKEHHRALERQCVNDDRIITLLWITAGVDHDKYSSHCSLKCS